MGFSIQKEEGNFCQILAGLIIEDLNWIPNKTDCKQSFQVKMQKRRNDTMESISSVKEIKLMKTGCIDLNKKKRERTIIKATE